jgi:hypothetical protein
MGRLRAKGVAALVAGVLAASASGAATAGAATASPGAPVWAVHAVVDPQLRVINGGFLLGQTPATCGYFADNGGAGLAVTGSGVDNPVTMTVGGNCFSEVQGQYDSAYAEEIYEYQNGDGHCMLVNPNNLFLYLTAGCAKGDTWELLVTVTGYSDVSGNSGDIVFCDNATCAAYGGLCAVTGSSGAYVESQDFTGFPDRCIWFPNV